MCKCNELVDSLLWNSSAGWEFWSVIIFLNQEHSMNMSIKWFQFVKGLFTQKGNSCHHLLTLKWFQSCINLLNTKEDILKKKEKMLMALLFLVFGIFGIFFPCYGSLWEPSTVWLPLFLKISSFVFNRIKKLIQVWNNLRVSKWWQNFNFWWTIPLNSHCLYNFVFLSSLCI